MNLSRYTLECPTNYWSLELPQDLIGDLVSLGREIEYKEKRI